jgi:hypothetical protein
MSAACCRSIVGQLSVEKRPAIAIGGPDEDGYQGFPPRQLSQFFGLEDLSDLGAISRDWDPRLGSRGPYLQTGGLDNGSVSD